MSENQFNLEEFMRKEPSLPVQPAAQETEEDDAFAGEPPELEVQQAVVQELAADKAALAADYENLAAHARELETALANVREELKKLENRLAEAENERKAAQSALDAEKALRLQKEEELARQLAKELDLQERNPNALALLDRDVDLPDRFPGETRDHVLEVVAAARDQAEAEGRIRRAQVLEGVLVANEPNGNLAKKRAALEKFFNENHNIMNGAVMAELDRCGISRKKGEEYLLPSEILLRTY